MRNTAGTPGKTGLQNRATFLARLTTASLGAFAGTAGVSAARSAETPSTDIVAGGNKATSKVRRWDVITIGNLSRNRYWGESDARGVRSAICTCTLVQCEGWCLLVDPSLEKSEEMARELDRRAGRRLQDVDALFITHEHGDHYAGLPHFPNAKWLAAPAVASLLNGSKKLFKNVEPVTGKLRDALEVTPTPGHTMSHHSLRFDCEGSSVLVAGDAVATRDFWRERRGYYNCVDFELAARSMEKIAAQADIIVPGHDNYFLK